MPISYIKDISETEFLFSHNNNVIEFITDSIESITNATVTINSTVLTLYPSPTGVFYLNFKEIVSALINNTNYKDDLDTDLSTSYVYDWSGRVYLNVSLEVKINFANATNETDTKDLNFLLGAVNLREYNNRYPLVSSIQDTLIGLPLVNQANNTYYAKYFKGYPFDVLVYKGLTYNSTMLVENSTNGLDYTFPLASALGFERLVFSDGESSTTIENVLPLVSGYNELAISTIGDAFLNLEVENGCSGVYLKWLNKNGGYSYWLFKNNEGNRKFKSLGYLNNDYDNLADTVSQEVGLGYNSNDNIKVYEQGITENQKNLIVSMLDSPKVYLFTGTPFSQNNFNDWMEVKLKQSTFVLKQVKRSNYNISISLELPNNYNITV